MFFGGLPPGFEDAFGGGMPGGMPGGAGGAAAPVEPEEGPSIEEVD